MIRRNATLRRRMMVSIGIVLTVLIIFAASLVYLRYSGTRQEIVQAQAIIKELTGKNTKAPTPTPEGTASDRIALLADEMRTKEVPFVACKLLQGMEPSPPWFSEQTLAEVTRILGKREVMTTTEEALDPRTHNAREIRATVCAILRESKSLAALREIAKGDDSLNPDNQSAWWRVREGMLPCLVCESTADNPQPVGITYLAACDNPDAAVSAYLDAYRVNLLCGSAGYVTCRLDNSLPAILDAVPGAVPEPIARDLLAAIDKPIDFEREKRDARLSAARRVTDRSDQRSKELKDVPLALCVSPIRVLRELAKPNPTRGSVNTTERALALVDSPPYLVRSAFKQIMDSVPESAHETRDSVWQVMSVCEDHHRHLAMAAIAHTVFALKQYKSEHGAYPPTLEGLTPDPISALPIEPYTGQPLLYWTDGDGFNINVARTAAKPYDASRQASWRALR